MILITLANLRRLGLLPIVCALSIVGCVATPPILQPQALQITTNITAINPSTINFDNAAPNSQRLLTNSLNKPILEYGDLIAARELWQTHSKHSNNIESGLQRYSRAKASCFLDAVFFEFNNGRNTPFSNYAYRQSMQLMNLWNKPAANKKAFWGVDIANDKTKNIVQNTSLIIPALKTKIESLKAKAAWACAPAEIACGEVALIHASSLQSNNLEALADSVSFFASRQTEQATRIIQSCISSNSTQAPIAKIAVKIIKVTPRVSSQLQSKFINKNTVNNQFKSAAIAQTQKTSRLLTAKKFLRNKTLQPSIKIATPKIKTAIPTAPKAFIPRLTTPKAVPKFISKPAPIITINTIESAYFLWDKSKIGSLKVESSERIEAIADFMIRQGKNIASIKLHGYKDSLEKDINIQHKRSQNILRYISALLSDRNVAIPPINIIKGVAINNKNKSRVDIELIPH